MSVKEFIEEVKKGNVDLDDFYSKFNEEVERKNKEFGFLITQIDVEKEKVKEKLFGVPVSVKEAICTKRVRTTAGSKILENYVPNFDATVISKVKENSGVIFGKTAMDEFGFGTFSTNCAFGVPKNPVDPSRVCGGSSGGAGAVVKALDMPNIAIAESTGGSISCPASFTGTIGLTPTYGVVSRYGLIDYANSLDKIGVIGKEIFDVKLLFDVMKGKDEKDSTSIDYKEKDDKVKVVGIPKEYVDKVTDEKVKDVFNESVEVLKEKGFDIKEVSLPNTDYALASYYILATSEASTNLAKYSGMRYGKEGEVEGKEFNEYFSEIRSKYFGDEVKRRIILGTYTRMAGYRDAYYIKAMKVRNLIIEDFKRAFKDVDVLMAPTMPIVAPKIKDVDKLSPKDVYAMDVLTVAPNLAGVPMLSVPFGKSKLPVGIHMIGDHLNEGKLFNVGSSLLG